MKQFFNLFLFVGILQALVYPQQQNYKHGELLVKFTPQTGVSSVLSESKFRDMNVKVKKYFPHLGIWHLTFNSPDKTDNEVLSNIKTDSRVLTTQFNHYVYPRSNYPNDTYFENQWALENTGQTGGTSGADISAPEAWNISRGNGQTALGDEIILAIVDGGFDIDHEDMNFTSIMYNAYIDSEDPNDMPVNYHGTAVASIAGALSNNSKGISGINWNIKTLPIAGSSSTESVVVAAYEYALGLRKAYNSSNGQNGEYIVATNSSFGIDYGDPDDYPIWCAAYDSLGVHGILNMAATANINIDIDEEGDVPTACSSNYLISVTNTDHNDNKDTGGAAWGATTIDLGAPGTVIYSALPNDAYGDYWGVYPLIGTSFSTPQVTGVVGLIYSIIPQSRLNIYKNNPSQGPLDVKAAILNSVDPNSSLEDITVTGGRLNANNSLKYIIENYGAQLGDGMDKIVFNDALTVKQNVTFSLKANLDLKNNISLSSGKTLTIEGINTVTLTAPSGTVTIGGLGGSSKIADNESDLPINDEEITTENATTKIFTLSQNFPNPFNPVTIISYSLPSSEKVIIKIYDVLGREIRNLINELKDAGEYSIIFDASSLASGIYFYRIEAGNFSQTKKLILAK